MANVERRWFRQVMAGHDAPARFSSDQNPDEDFDGAVADPAVISAAPISASITFSDAVSRLASATTTGRPPSSRVAKSNASYSNATRRAGQRCSITNSANAAICTRYSRLSDGDVPRENRL
ncbi:DUF664 domain-containing protein [Sphaerisporangium perillae]|uniref:DUF664 domain-containing protein n=1 Tax=Sphaerisporangium perillae TaxID=2935860 RepID=UPI0024357239|nr:DUF664 domain-containing protein [Sphaerisporangium perillae]